MLLRGLHFVQQVHRVDGCQLISQVVGGDLVQLLLDGDTGLQTRMVVVDSTGMRGRCQIHRTARRRVRTGDRGTLRDRFERGWRSGVLLLLLLAEIQRRWPGQIVAAFAGVRLLALKVRDDGVLLERLEGGVRHPVRFGRIEKGVLLGGGFGGHGGGYAGGMT